MTITPATPAAVFVGLRQQAQGPLGEILAPAKAAHEAGEAVLIFADDSGRVIDVDFRGSLEEVVSRLPPAPSGEGPEPARGRGRPKLGVTPREVTLLPRHWEWLAAQPGGASAALRRLVDEARKAGDGKDRLRQGREAVYRFASAMAGNAAGYEEAIRALFAGDRSRFEAETQAWPGDVRAYALHLAERAF